MSCSTTPNNSEQFPTGAIVEPISFEDYERAYYDFVACLGEQGIGITELGLNEDRVFEYLTDADAEFEAATGTIPEDRCYNEHFADADDRWQYVAYADLREQDFERGLACLAARGVNDPPQELINSRQLGDLLAYGVSVVGESILRDFQEGTCP